MRLPSLPTAQEKGGEGKKAPGKGGGLVPGLTLSAARVQVVPPADFVSFILDTVLVSGASPQGAGGLRA